MAYKIQVFLSMNESTYKRFNLEDNKAGLINDLLVKHYNDSKLKSLKPEQIRRLMELVKQKEAIEKEYEAIKNGQS